MKNSFYVLLLIGCAVFGQKYSADVRVFNYSNQSINGKLVINSKDTISIQDSVTTISLKKKRNHMEFISNNTNARIDYPKKLNKISNTISISLHEKGASDYEFKPIQKLTYGMSFQKMDSIYNSNQMGFYLYGLGAFISKSQELFAKKYGIEFNVNGGCIVDSFATENNHLVGFYLDKKFGKAWRKELGYTPIGVTK